VQLNTRRERNEAVLECLLLFVDSCGSSILGKKGLFLCF
jgi:hypothetical protein